MLEGSVTLTEGGTRLDFEQGDVVFVPQQAGLKVSWDTSSYGRFFYVTYPHWR
jgi:ethanolamine utilization protein EutQ (cupin superfamily)